MNVAIDAIELTRLAVIPIKLVSKRVLVGYTAIGVVTSTYWYAVFEAFYA